MIKELEEILKIKEKLSCKLVQWKARLFSQVGNTVLIKSELKNIPLFTMKGIKRPNNIVKEITMC